MLFGEKQKGYCAGRDREQAKGSREAERGRRALRARVLHALHARTKQSPAAVGTNDFGILAIRITRLVSYARLRLCTPKEYFRADRIAASFRCLHQVELGNAGNYCEKNRT